MSSEHCLLSVVMKAEYTENGISQNILYFYSVILTIDRFSKSFSKPFRNFSWYMLIRFYIHQNPLDIYLPCPWLYIVAWKTLFNFDSENI